jgi:gluconokinase
MSTDEVIIGLDVGTTGVKAVAFDIGTSWRHLALREYPLLQPAPDRQVQEPATIITAAGEALAECVRVVGERQVIALSLSAGMHGVLALDEDLRPLTPLVTWADARARDQARALRRSGHAPRLHALTGVPVHPMSPLTKLMWFAEHDPRTCAAARWWIGLKDYLLLWLTGKLVTELSSASGTGLLDLASRTWSEDALALTGVSRDQLPEILPTTAVLELAEAPARRAGLPAGTPVITGAADGPLGNLGTGAVTPGVAGLSLGTSGAIRMAVDQPSVDEDGTLFCYALTDAMWVIGGATSTGGVAVRWAGEALAPDVAAAAGDEGPDAAVLELAASVPAGSAGLLMVPYLLAERAPLWDPDLPGAYLGLRREHTRAHLIRAAVEGVCMQMRVILDRLDTLQPVQSIRATGGVFRSMLWREVMAATLDRPFSVIGSAEGTALGAAALGLFALERTPHLGDALALLVPPDTPVPAPVEPNPELVALYAEQREQLAERIDELGRVAALYRAVP